MKKFSVGLLLANLLLATAAHAAPGSTPPRGTKDKSAQPPPPPPPVNEKVAEAERLFTEAKRLMAASHVSEACHAFEESQKLDPAVGTQFNIADCYEREGRLATAWKQFTDLRDVLARVGDDRAPQAEARAHALDAKLPRLVVRIPWAKKVSGVVVNRDGELLEPSQLEIPIPLNPGEHQIHVQATNRKDFDAAVTAVEGKTVTLAVPEPAEVGQRVVVQTTGLSQRSLGIIVGGVGIAAVSTSVILGLVAKSSYDDAVGGCTDLGDRYQCPAGDKSANAASAQSMGTVATIVGGIGAAAIVAGGVLWLTGSRSPKSHEKQTAGVRLVPMLDPSRAGLLLTGSL